MPAAPHITRMLDLIVCPACRGPLAFKEREASLTCKACARQYSVQDGIPVLIPERAQA